MRTKREDVRIGLALGGGGMRGLAHVGVLKVLDAEGIRAGYLAGTSIGAMVAAAYAAGHSAADIEAEVLRLNQPAEAIRLLDWLPSRRGLMKGEGIVAFLDSLLGEGCTFADLEKALAVTATDLLAGEERVFREGSVVDAVRASIAIPGIFTPVEREGRLYVDGGLLNNVPADVARDLGADVVIAVDVAASHQLTSAKSEEEHDLYHDSLLPNVAIDLWQALAIMMDRLTQQRLAVARPEVIVRPRIPVGAGALSGIGHAQALIDSGREAMEQALPSLRAALEAAIANQQHAPGDVEPNYT